MGFHPKTHPKTPRTKALQGLDDGIPVRNIHAEFVDAKTPKTEEDLEEYVYVVCLCISVYMCLRDYVVEVRKYFTEFRLL